MGKTIVILGASFGGLPIAHYLLKHTAPVTDIKVILVSPNTHMYWNLASVRGILPDQFPDEKLFYPIAPAFEKYASSKFEFLVGKAEKLEPGSNSVTVRTNDGAERSIRYDIVILATGAGYRDDMPFKSLSSTEETKKALHAWQERIKAAKSIVVAGAGITGVETAAELGEEYAKHGAKEVIIVHNKDLPFDDRLMMSVRQTTKKELEKLRVRFIGSAKVTSAAQEGQTVVEINHDSGKQETLKADVFIPTYGVVPNTAYLPPNMLDSRGYVKTTNKLSVDGYDNIFVVGDMSNIQETKATSTDAQLVYLSKALHARLTGGKVTEYVPSTTVMMGLSLGKNRGTGQIGTWKPFSSLIWYLKSRYLGTDTAGEIVAGNKTLSQKNW